MLWSIIRDIILVSFVASGVALMARALPWPKAWTRRKPLACPTCMAGWSALAACWVLRHDDMLVSAMMVRLGDTYVDMAMMWLASIPLTAMVVRWMYPPDIELPQ
jgi:hypothetical protein